MQMRVEQPRPLRRLLALLLLAGLPAELLLHQASDAPAAAAGLVYACCLLLAAYALRPDMNPAPARVLAWSGITALASLTLVTLRCAMQGEAALWLAAGVFALLLLLLAATLLLETLGLPGDAAAGLVVTLAGLAGTAPLWLGPLAAASTPDTFLTQVTIHVSPLSHLAALLDFDYLRSSWFYRHSPLGGVRYSYPDARISLALCLLLAVSLLTAGSWQRERSRSVRLLQQPGNHEDVPP